MKSVYCIILLLLFVYSQADIQLSKSVFWNSWTGIAYAHGGGGGGGGGSGGDGGGGGGGDACGGSSDGTTSPCSNNDPVPEHQAPGGGGVDAEPHIILAINADQVALRKARNAGLTIGRKVTLRNLNMVVTRLQVPENMKEKDICAKLAKTKGNTQFDLNHYYELANKPKPEKAVSYPKVMMGWPPEPIKGGFSPRIGMVDTRIAVKIPPLTRQRITTRSFAGSKGLSSADHGTSIATILVGDSGSRFPGLLPEARLYNAIAFSCTQNGRLRTTALAIARAVNWLVSVPVQAINLSLTGPDNSLLKTTVVRTSARHIFLIAAAGNGGPYAPPAYPAAYDSVIAVTAVDRFLRPYRWANRGKYIAFAAPGVHVWLPGADGRGQWKDGTSYASAFCTALVAQLTIREKIAGCTSSLIQLMKGKSIDLGAPGKDDIFGWGLIHN